MGFVVFRDWKRELLEVRGLAHPDGRPLYAYRLSDVEFNELEELLRDWLGKLQERFGLTQLTKLSGFSGLFVLYGSEWWRRRFDGAHWSWDPILSELGADPGGWSPPQRSDFVRLDGLVGHISRYLIDCFILSDFIRKSLGANLAGRPYFAMVDKVAYF